MKGIIINKFRGKKESLESGIKKLEELTGVPVLGIVPYGNIDIEDEDRVTDKLRKLTDGTINIAVINLNHLSNFTDMDPLKRIKDVNIDYIDEPYELDKADIIIIPGSKNTIHDMEIMREKKMDIKIKELYERGKIIIGICAGFQILGKTLKDMQGIEGNIQISQGLGILDIDTVFLDGKMTTQYKGELKNTSGILEGLDGEKIEGFEIHHGASFTKTETKLTDDTFVKAVVKENVFGTYIHGIFENNRITEKILNIVREKKGISELKLKETFEEYREKEFDKLEKLLRENLDIEKIYEIIENN